MPDLLTVLNNAQSEAPVNAAGASPAYNPFEQLREDYSENGLSRILNQETGVSNTPLKVDNIDKYVPYGVYFNDIDTEADMNRVRAENQSVGEQLGRMLIQTGADRVGLGILRGFSDVLDPIYSLISDDELQDYSNPVSAKIEEWQNAIRDRYEIYRKDPSKGIDISDFAWYMNGLTDVASTVSLYVPAWGISKAIGLAGKGLSLAGKALRTAERVGDVGSKLGISAKTARNLKEGAKLLGQAGLMRIGENYQEAREVYNDIKDNTTQLLSNMSAEEREKLYSRRPDFVNMSDDEIATKLAEDGATNTFVEDMFLIGLDALQLRALPNVWKGFTNRAKTATIREAQANAVRGLAGETAEEVAEEGFRGISRKFSKYIPTFNTLKDYVGEWTEGLEEAYQYVAQTHNTAVAKSIINNKEYIPTFSDYLTDSQMWNSAIWGFVGGAMFQGIMTAGQSAVDKIMKREDAGTKARIEEINGRQAVLNNLLQDLSDAYEKRTPRLDNEGNIVKDSRGDTIYDDLSDEEAALRVEEIKNKYILDLVYNAANKGNYDLLKDMFSSRQAKKYIDDNLNSQENSEDFIADVTSRMDKVYNTYLEELEKADSAGIKNPGTVEKVAYSNVVKRSMLNDLIDRGTAISGQIDSLYGGLINGDTSSLSPLEQGILAEAVSEYNTKASNNMLSSYIQQMDARKQQNEQLHKAGLIGDLAFEREQKNIDDTVSKVAAQYGITKDGKVLTDINEIREFISNPDNILLNGTIDTIEQYSKDLLANLNNREVNRLQQNILKSQVINKKEDYLKSAEYHERLYEAAREATYQSAKKALEDIYNTADNIDDVTNYIKTRNRGGLSEQTANDITTAYTTMANFVSREQDEDVERDIDNIIKDAKAKRNAPRVTTPQGAVTNPKLDLNDNAQAATNPGTNTTQSSVENNNPAPVVEQSPAVAIPQTPTPEEQLVAGSPVGNTLNDDESPAPDFVENNSFAQFAEQERQEVRKELDIQKNVAKRLKTYKEELKTSSASEIYSKIRPELVDDFGEDFVNENERTINSFIASAKALINLGVEPGVFRSAVDFGEILFNPTNDNVLALLDEYAATRKINTFNNKVPISLRSLIRYIYNKNKTIDPTVAYQLYENIRNGLAASRGKFSIRENIKNKYTLEDIKTIMSESKEDPIKIDSRINLNAKDNDNPRAANYALAKLNDGSLVTVRRNAHNNGVDFSASGAKIGYNIFRKTNDGVGYVFKSSDKVNGQSYFSYNLYKNNGEYSSPLLDIFDIIINNKPGTYKINGQTINITEKDINEVRSVLEYIINNSRAIYDMRNNKENIIDDDKYNSLKTNKVVEYIFTANMIPNTSKNILVGINDKSGLFERLSNILRYPIDNIRFADIDDPSVLFDSIKDWVAREYENYAYTEQLFNKLQTNPVVQIPVKSLNRGKPQYSTNFDTQLVDAIPQRVHNSVQVVRLINGDKVSEDGKLIRQHISDNGTSLPHYFQIALPNGTKYPEFVDISQAEWTNEGYGKAIADELYNLFIKHLNSEDENSYDDLYKHLKSILDIDGLIIDSKIYEDNGTKENNYSKKIIIGSPTDEKAKIVIYKYNKDNSVAHNISVKIDNADSYNILLKDSEGLSNILRNAITHILTGAKYSFPAAILDSGINENVNEYIKKTDTGYDLKIGNMEKVEHYPTFASFMIANKTATTNLRKITHKRGNQSEIEDNYDYFDNNGFVPNNRAAARLTLEPNVNEYEAITEEELKRRENTETNRIDEINKIIDEGNKEAYEIQTFVNTVSPNFGKAVFDKEYYGVSLRGILPSEIDIKPNELYNNEQNTSGLYNPTTGRITLFKPYFDKIKSNNGDYQAMRILLHESIHKQIKDNSIPINTTMMNSRIGEVWDALQKAINDVNSSEYKDLKNAYGDNVQAVINNLKDNLQTIIDNTGGNIASRNEELIVEAITSKNFSDVLNNINTPNEKVGEPKTLLQKILQFIRNLFNFGRNGNNKIKDDTLLAKVFNSFTEEVSAIDQNPVRDDTITEDYNDDGYDESYDDNAALFSNVDFDNIEIPNKNALASILSVSENASMTEMFERGELQMRCV